MVSIEIEQSTMTTASTTVRTNVSNQSESHAVQDPIVPAVFYRVVVRLWAIAIEAKESRFAVYTSPTDIRNRGCRVLLLGLVIFVLEVVLVDFVV